MPSEQHTKRDLPDRILRILSEARTHFQSDQIQRGRLRSWYEERYGNKYVPPEIIKNGYLQVPGRRGFYWLDPEKMNASPTDDQGNGDADELGDNENSAQESNAETEFALEHQLRDFIAHNLGTISVEGKRLRLYTDPEGRKGVEYPSAVGPIDILAVDDLGAFFVFELKRDRSPDKTIGQLSRYMGWVKHSLASSGKGEVHGIIVAQKIPDNLRFGASVFPNVSLFEYEVEFRLKPAHQLPAM
jgi:endonuclease